MTLPDPRIVVATNGSGASRQATEAVPGAGRPGRSDPSDAGAERADPCRTGGEERACGLLLRGSLPRLPVL